LNWYAYCNNNPVRYVDPDGQSWQDVEDFFAGVSESLVENFGGTGAGSVYGSPDSTAYYAGKIFGDVTSTVVGKAISGGGAALTGVGVSTSEVGVGVPVVAAGIAVTAYGTKVTASGVANGVKDSRAFMKSSNRSSGKSIVKVSDSYLKKNGIDAHEFKKEYLGKKARISHYDIYKDRKGQLVIYEKGGKGSGIKTGEYLD
jgi:hypothetical protein